MKATINGITYEGTVDEIRQMAENPPNNFTYLRPGAQGTADNSANMPHIRSADGLTLGSHYRLS